VGVTMPVQKKRRSALLLATGQVTQYGGNLDDGYYKKGVTKAYTILTTGAQSGTTNITLNGKTDAHSNNCVIDNNTGLMWSRYVCASLGPTSDGRLPWTTNANGEGIFTYCAAANAASLGGYTDWRIPNIFELFLLYNHGLSLVTPDTTAFPGWPNSNLAIYGIWSSTTQGSGTGNAMYIITGDGAVGRGFSKSNNLYTALVRG